MNTLEFGFTVVIRRTISACVTYSLSPLYSYLARNQLARSKEIST